MVEKTDYIISRLSKFLGTKSDKKTNLIIKERKCGNRIIKKENRLCNKKNIEKHISIKYLNILNKLEKIYEKKIKFSNLEFKKYIWLENLILVTGTHTSGKSMISPVIASLKVEILRKIYYLDQLANLHFLIRLQFKSAKFMANHILDLSYYEQLIGRNMNFRYEDETSVMNSKDPKILYEKIKVKRGSQIIKKHQKINTQMLLDTHDGIWFNKFWLKFGNKKI